MMFLFCSRTKSEVVPGDSQPAGQRGPLAAGSGGGQRTFCSARSCRRPSRGGHRVVAGKPVWPRGPDLWPALVDRRRVPRRLEGAVGHDPRLQTTVVHGRHMIPPCPHSGALGLCSGSRPMSRRSPGVSRGPGCRLRHRKRVAASATDRQRAGSSLMADKRRETSCGLSECEIETLCRRLIPTSLEERPSQKRVAGRTVALGAGKVLRRRRNRAEIAFMLF